MDGLIRKARAPLRISFAGGGTDMEPYISDYGSCVLSVAVKYYSRATYLSKYEPHSEMETLLSQMVAQGGVMITGDQHPMGGLGGSASGFVCGIKSIYPNLNKEQIAHLAFFLERNVMKVVGGWQDQFCAAFGGFLFLTFESGGVEITTLAMPPELCGRLLLIYVGGRINSGFEVIADQLTRYNVKALHRQKQIAKEMKQCIEDKRFTDFASLLNEAWEYKKALSPLVTNDAVDQAYNRCISLGAGAGILTGAGGGGYLLLMEDLRREVNLRQNLLREGIMYWNIEIDNVGVEEIT